jgi:two-component system, cell cycle response regulator DivK
MELCKRSVVVVGHSTTTRRVVQLSLNLEGYGVHIADSAHDARRLIDEHWPEAVVIDVGPGSMEALALAREIRKSRFHRHMVIVACAPVALADQEREAIEAGCDAFVARPGETNELGEVLEAFLADNGILSVSSRAQSEALRWN